MRYSCQVLRSPPCGGLGVRSGSSRGRAAGRRKTGRTWGWDGGLSTDRAESRHGHDGLVLLAATSRVLRLNASDTTVEFLDPALNYDFIGWRLEYLTCARLLSYPDKPGAAGARLVPEVARGMPRVGNGGRTYTFTVRRDFRFSDGTAVTPRSFVRAIERALHPKMQSPAANFVSDITGAGAVQKGARTTPSGVVVKGAASRSRSSVRRPTSWPASRWSSSARCPRTCRSIRPA